jgi:hypothetical protein
MDPEDIVCAADDISSWDVSSVILKKRMFGATDGIHIQQLDYLPNAWQNDDDEEECFQRRIIRWARTTGRN